MSFHSSVLLPFCAVPMDRLLSDMDTEFDEAGDSMTLSLMKMERLLKRNSPFSSFCFLAFTPFSFPGWMFHLNSPDPCFFLVLF